MQKFLGDGYEQVSADYDYDTDLCLDQRRASSFSTQRADQIYQDSNVGIPRFKICWGYLTDTSSLVRIFQDTQTDELYNLPYSL